jgi:hypothetical protein
MSKIRYSAAMFLLLIVVLTPLMGRFVWQIVVTLCLVAANVLGFWEGRWG